MSYGLAGTWLRWPMHFRDLILVDDLGVQKYNDLLYVPLDGIFDLSGDQADKISRLIVSWER